MINQPQDVTKSDYVTLARFRYTLRLFLRFSELAARNEGLTPQQHQLLLAIKGRPDRDWATIGEIAELLQMHHNAAVQLVDRVALLGFVRRSDDPNDRRVARVSVTPKGEAILERLSALHRDELRRLRLDIAPIFTIADTKSNEYAINSDVELIAEAVAHPE